MAIARVAKAPNSTTITYSSGVASLSVTFSADTTTGNALVAGCGIYDSTGATVITFSDSGGHSWTVPCTSQTGDTLQRVSIGYVLGITGRASHQVTATPVETSDIALGCCEYSGVGAYEAQNSNTGTGTTASSGSVSPAGNCVYYAHINASQTVTYTRTWAGAATLYSGSYDEASELLDSGAENPSWSLNNSRTWVAGIVAFSEANPVVWYDHDGVKPFSSLWRSGRI